jgi:serine/threonine-protein kinase
MGQVFLARAVGPGGFAKPVVLKRMHLALAKIPELVDRFLREARIQANLVCPSIVQVLDFGRMDDTYFLVLEYVHGVDLGVLLKKSCTPSGGVRHPGPLPVGVAVRIALDVCRGLDYAHRARDPSGAPLGLVHRDVSPPNVLVSFEGDAKLGDFGIVHANAGGAAQPGVIVGKPAYLSPEQARGESVDPRSDLFALGTVLYFELTGVEPFRGPTRAATLERVQRASVEPVESSRPDVPPALREILRRAMQRDPADRYPDAATMLAALETVALDLGAAATGRAVQGRMQELFPGAAERDPWASGGARPQALELSRLVAEDGVTVLTTAEPIRGARVPIAHRRWAWLAGTGVAAAAALVLALGTTSGGHSTERHPPARAVGMPARGLGGAPRAVVRARSADPPRAPADPPPATPPRAPAAPPLTRTPGRSPDRRPPPVVAPEPPPPQRASLVGDPGPAPAIDPLPTGRLRVGSTPGWGWVWVDGRRVGTTPLDIEVEAGPRRVKVVGGRTGREQEFPIRVEPGATRALQLEPFE